MRRGIEPHVPLLDREHQTKGFFTRADFTFDRPANVGSRHRTGAGFTLSGHMENFDIYPVTARPGPV